MTSPIATLPGFPFFYAIPIDGQIREIPSQPSIWPEELEGFAEDNFTLQLLNPPPYSKPLPPTPPQASLSNPLPSVQETNEVLNRFPPSYLPIIIPVVPDDDMITPQTVRARTEPVISKTKTQRRKIRYPSLPIGRWAQPSSNNDDSPKDVNNFGKIVPRDSVVIHKRKLRFPSISGRGTWSSFRPSLGSPLSASATMSTISIDLPPVLEMPHELEAIETISPLSPFNELDSTPVSELSSENNSQQSSPAPEQEQFPILLQIQVTSAPSETPMTPVTPKTPPTPSLPDRSPFRSWYVDDDAGELSVISRQEEEEDLNDPPPRLSEDCSPPPHEEATSASCPSSPKSFLDLDLDSEDTDSTSSSARSSWTAVSPPTPPTTNATPATSPEKPKDFEGDVKENIPDLANLPARPQSFLLMTEEEVYQAEVIEDIFLMLHDLQPGYLHPAHRPQPNVVRMSMLRRYATQIQHAERIRAQV